MTPEDVTGRTAAFLADLTALTKKHRIAISGCCASPHIYPLNDEDLAGAYYAVDAKERFESLGDIFAEKMAWVAPESIWHSSWPGYGGEPLVGPEGLFVRKERT